jgi:hypothetical protein
MKIDNMEDIKPKITDEYGERDNKGRFLQGNVGKPKGATNKTTKELQQFITNFLNEKSFEIPLIWDSLDDKDKATLFIHLSKLVMPKSVNDTDKSEINRFEFDVPELTQSQIDKLIDNL